MFKPLSIEAIYSLTKDIIELTDLALNRGASEQIVNEINRCLGFLEVDTRNSLLKYFDKNAVEYFITPSDVLYDCLGDDEYKAVFPPMAEGNALYILCVISEYHVVNNLNNRETINSFKEQIKELSLFMSQYKHYDVNRH